MKKLNNICDMILDIEEGLLFGTIDFYYDNLMSAMKPGHPMEILDSILAEIFWDIQSNKIPDREHIENVLENCKAFKETFKIKEMEKPIKALEKYLCPKKEYTFPIYINESGKSFVEYPLSETEVKRIKKAMDNMEDFENTNGLKTLYKKVMKAAKEKIEEDIDLTMDDIDIDSLGYNIGYPELD